ncbi:MAG: hypothetical protein MUO68_10620 [Desulfobacteraceae bacterium]|nr:hypothetical protein [Desulfobacteraceae bacterium]
MKIRPTAVIALFCLSLVVNVLSGNILHAQDSLSGTPEASGPFVSDVVTPAVSQEVWQLRVTEPRDSTVNTITINNGSITADYLVVQ